MKQSRVLENFGWWIFLVLALAPAVMWAFEMPLGPRLLNLAAFSKSLGDLAGLTGMAMFSLVIILSSRLKIFEKVFNIEKSPRGEYEITDAISLLAKEKKVKIKKINNFWMDFGRPEDVEKLSKFLEDENIKVAKKIAK